MREARREYLNVNDETPLLAVARLFRESLPRGREIKGALCLAGENIDSYTPTGKFVQRARAHRASARRGCRVASLGGARILRLIFLVLPTVFQPSVFAFRATTSMARCSLRSSLSLSFSRRRISLFFPEASTRRSESTRRDRSSASLLPVCQPDRRTLGDKIFRFLSFQLERHPGSRVHRRMT